MATVLQALEEAKKTLLGREGIQGIGIKANRLIVYAGEGVSVPASVLGVPVEVVRTGKFVIQR